jgi:predicted phage gp36 major capsid-like protein
MTPRPSHVKTALLEIVEAAFEETHRRAQEAQETAAAAAEPIDAIDAIETEFHALAVTDDASVETQSPSQSYMVTYWTAKNFLESLSWYVDEATFDEKLGGFMALPRSVVFEALGTVDVCKTIASTTIVDDDEALVKVIGYTETNRALMTGHTEHTEHVKISEPVGK